MNFMSISKVWNVWEQFKTQHQKNWSYGIFKKSKARVTNHDDQSKEHHHEGANLDQSCRSERSIVQGDTSQLEVESPT